VPGWAYLDPTVSVMTHKNRLDPYCIFASRQIASIRLEPSRARVKILVKRTLIHMLQILPSLFSPHRQRLRPITRHPLQGLPIIIQHHIKVVPRRPRLALF